MNFTDKEMEMIRAERAAYMKEYRQRPEYQDYINRPDVKQRQREAEKRCWLRKAKKLQVAK